MSAPIGACVYTVRKKCWECGTEWDGKAFTRQPDGAAPLPGFCDECITKDEERVRELQKHRTHSESGENLPALDRPRRATDVLDDDGPEDYHLRIAP